MKQKFSTKWKASKQPRKKRKYIAKAPLHIKRKFLSANLSKELRKKYERRNIELRKDDKVRILRGKFKNKQGKITRIFTNLSKVTIEGIQRKKLDGSQVEIKIVPSNLQIVSLYEEDKKRFKKFTNDKKIKEKKDLKSDNLKKSTQTKKLSGDKK